MTKIDVKENELKLSKDFPLKQGSLDFLCSVYAAINAMVLRDEITELDQAAIPFRLGLMFMQSKHDWDLAQAVCHGINEDHYLELLNQMSWREWNHFTDFNSPKMDEKVKRLLVNNASSIIVSLVRPTAKKFDPDQEREVVHYTVITKAINGGYEIKDSQGVEKIIKRGGKLFYGDEAVKFGCIYSM